jgi:uncharacterized membrane protein
MSRCRVTIGLACVLIVSAIATAPAGGAASASPTSNVELSLDRARVSTRLGDSFTFTSRITNAGQTALSGLVAHLNIVSLSKGVYVDPEDWSSQRTRYLDRLQPGEATDVSWTVKGVNGGHFAIYVVALPGRTPATTAQGLAVSPALEVHVIEHKTINPGGVLPLALGVPAFLGLLTLGLRFRRRRAPS